MRSLKMVITHMEVVTMKKLYTVFTLLIAIALAAFTMTACLGGDSLPNNPKGQVMNQPSSTPPADSAAPPAEGANATPPPAGGEKPAAPAGGGEEGDEMPGGGT
jgi:hypothetical protein